MKMGISLLATLSLFSMTAGSAQAQRGRGMYNTPFGQFSSADLQANGGNPFQAQAAHEQKLMMQQQQLMLRQQQQYMQQVAQQEKAYKDYLKKHPEAAKAAMKPAVATKKKAATKAKSKTQTATTTTTPAASTPSTVPGAPPATRAK